MNNLSIIISLVLCLILSIVARATSFGWVTVFSAIAVIPIFIVHGFLQIRITNRENGNNRAITTLSIISNVLFLLASIIIPDGNDATSGYSTFGFVKNSPEYFGTVAMISFGVAIYLSLMATYMSKKSHNKLSKRDAVTGAPS